MSDNQEILLQVKDLHKSYDDLAVLKPDVGEKTVLLLNSEENSALFAGKFRIPAGERHDMKRAVPVPDSGKDGA